MCFISSHFSHRQLLIIFIFISVSGVGCPTEKGFCVKRNGHDQNLGVKKINSLDGNTPARQQQCLEFCRGTGGATGCEVIWDNERRGCYAHTQEIARGNGQEGHKCWVFSKCQGRNI